MPADDLKIASERLSQTSDVQQKFQVYLQDLSCLGLAQHYFAQLRIEESGDVVPTLWDGTFDEDYLEEFHEQGLHSHDLAAEFCRWNAGLFRWDTMHGLHGSGLVPREYERTLEFVRDHGFVNAATLALPRRANSEGLIFGGISVSGEKGVREKEFYTNLTRHTDRLIGITSILFEQIDLVALTESFFDLTERELQCLRLSARGMRVQQISDILAISDRTTAHHLTQARRKLDAKTNTQAVARAIRLELI